MTLDALIAAAKERLHRSIGQRARFAKAAVRADAKRLAARVHWLGRT